MLTDLVEVYNSPIAGHGLRARSELRRGAIVWTRDPQLTRFHRSEIESWPREVRKRFWPHSHQVSEDWFSGPLNGEVTDSGDFQNHSCDPNTGFADDDTMVALRDIAAGEELTYDYAMTELDEGYEMECRCGTSLCRGRVRGGDYSRLPELQERYRSMVMAHVARSASGADHLT